MQGIAAFLAFMILMLTLILVLGEIFIVLRMPL
jgi:hypothetical protein